MHRVVRPRIVPLRPLLALRPRLPLHVAVEFLQDQPARVPPRLAHGLCQRGEVIVSIVVFNIIHAKHFPAERRGDFCRVGLAQVPAVRFAIGRKWPDHRRGLRVGVRQCRHGGFAAAWAGTALEIAHKCRV